MLKSESSTSGGTALSSASASATATASATAASTKEGEIDLVQIDGLAVLKIIKHCHEETSGVLDVAQGVLLGLVVDNKLEITNCFPFPRQPDETMDEGIFLLKFLFSLSFRIFDFNWNSYPVI